MAGGAPAAVVPTEDTIQALIDHLVGPLLPLRAASHEPPPLSKQDAVAKQMHAVVLLYNYYHRKHFPQLEFLDFEAFCKAASIAKLSLLTYMKYMNRCEEDLGDLDKQLSVTEKKILDACNICSALDASKDAPSMEEWPISRVAVFLSDPAKKKCLLQFSSITQGVWSLVERDLEMPIGKFSRGPQTKMHALKNKKAADNSLGNGSYVNDDVLDQLVLSIVEKKTGASPSEIMLGISRANLSILECHVAYSLSQEKTTTFLYIIKYTKVGSNGDLEVSIEEMLSSLRGPIVRMGLAPEVTSVVEYFHLLPYVDILSEWLSRDSCKDGPFHLLKEKIAVDGQCFLGPNKKPIMVDCETNCQTCKTKQNVDIPSPMLIKPANESINKNGDCLTGSSGVSCNPQNEVVNSSMEPCRLPNMEDQAMNVKIALSNKTNSVKNGIINDRENGGSCKSGSSEAVSRLQNKTGSSLLQRPHQSLNDGDDKYKEHVISNAHTDKREKEKLQARTDAVASGSKDKADTGDPVKRECISGGPLARADSREADVTFQDGTITSDLPIFPMECSPKSYDADHLLLTPRKNELLQASLCVLQKKRDKLCNQHRLLEDEIARCEMNIQTIFSAGENNVMLRVDSILEACNTLCSRQMQMGTSSLCCEQSPPQPIKRKRLSEAVLTLRSPCQELDDICCGNNWILPRYTVLPSIADGKFQANVIVQGVDFECTYGGDLKSSPREARESAAMHMLSKLRSMAGQEH